MGGGGVILEVTTPTRIEMSHHEGDQSEEMSYRIQVEGRPRNKLEVNQEGKKCNFLRNSKFFSPEIA